MRLGQVQVPLHDLGPFVHDGAELGDCPRAVLLEQADPALDHVGLHVPLAGRDRLVDAFQRRVELPLRQVGQREEVARLEDLRGPGVLFEGQALPQQDDGVVDPTAVQVQGAQGQARAKALGVEGDPRTQLPLRVRHPAPLRVEPGNVQPGRLVVGLGRQQFVQHAPGLFRLLRAPVQAGQGDPVAGIAGVQRDHLAQFDRRVVGAPLRRVQIGERPVQRQVLPVPLEPFFQGLLRLAGVLLQPVGRREELVGVRPLHPLRQEPFEVGPGFPDLIPGQPGGALEEQRVLVPGVRRKKQLGLLHRLFPLPAAEEQFSELKLGLNVARVELHGLRQRAVRPPEVPPPEVRHPQHVVGFGELRIDLDGVPELEAGPDVVRLFVEGLPLIEELHLLRFGSAAGNQQDPAKQNGPEHRPAISHQRVPPGKRSLTGSPARRAPPGRRPRRRRSGRTSFAFPPSPPRR